MTDRSQTTRTGGAERSAPPPPPFDGWNGGTTPPGGGATPPGGPPYRGLDLSPLLALIDALRRLIPAELQDQFNALQRELLLTVRALIDWRLERLERLERAPAVEDIPID
jgi:hypothetical protein